MVRAIVSLSLRASKWFSASSECAAVVKCGEGGLHVDFERRDGALQFDALVVSPLALVDGNGVLSMASIAALGLVQATDATIYVKDSGVLQLCSSTPFVAGAAKASRANNSRVDDDEHDLLCARQLLVVAGGRIEVGAKPLDNSNNNDNDDNDDNDDNATPTRWLAQFSVKTAAVSGNICCSELIGMLRLRVSSQWLQNAPLALKTAALDVRGAGGFACVDSLAARGVVMDVGRQIVLSSKSNARVETTLMLKVCCVSPHSMSISHDNVKLLRS
jgi:hypothetical protein